MKKDRDFISPLLGRYLEDLTERQRDQNWKGAKLSAVARKMVLLGELDSLISETAGQAVESRKSVAAKNIELQAVKKLDDRDARINDLCENRLAYK